MRFYAWGTVVLQASSSIGPRTLTLDEIVWIIEGEVRYLCEETEYLLYPGDIVLIPHGVEHSFLWDSRKQTVHGYIELESCDLIAQSQVYRGGIDSVATPLLQHALKLLSDRPEGWQRLATTAIEYCLECLRLDVHRLTGSIRLEVLPPPLRACIDHIRNRWNHGGLCVIPTWELTEASSLSKSQLTRLFNSYFGLSPSGALRCCRLSYGAQLLMYTGLSVKEIASKTGFDSPYHFSREFKGLYRVSPSGFRLNPSLQRAKRSSFDEYLWGDHSWLRPVP